MKILRDKSYKVSKNSTTSSGKVTMKVTLHEDTGLNIDDRVYQYLRSDGIVILVPENKLDEFLLKQGLQAEGNGL